jgi:hypothetical protein
MGFHKKSLLLKQVGIKIALYNEWTINTFEEIIQVVEYIRMELMIGGEGIL